MVAKSKACYYETVGHPMLCNSAMTLCSADRSRQMPMTEAARSAFEKLKQIGIPVTEPEPVEGDPEGTQFYLPYASYSGHQTYVDGTRNWLIPETGQSHLITL